MRVLRHTEQAAATIPRPRAPPCQLLWRTQRHVHTLVRTAPEVNFLQQRGGFRHRPQGLRFG